MNPLLDIIRAACSPMAPLPTGLAPRLSPLPGIRTVLFDVYGTLFCSGTGDIGVSHAQRNDKALVDALETAGLTAQVRVPPTTILAGLKSEIELEHRQCRARGTDTPEIEIREIWQRVLRTPGWLDPPPPAIADGASLAALALTYECAVNPVWPLPGAQATLAELRSSGHRLGIVSNAQFYTPLLFEALLGASAEELGFAPELCAWSYRLRAAKPSARMFSGVLAALATQGVAAHQTVYVGNDMLNDVWTASQAGCRTVLFAGDRRSLRLREAEPRCTGLEADAVITELRQLPALLQPLP